MSSRTIAITSLSLDTSFRLDAQTVRKSSVLLLLGDRLAEFLMMAGRLRSIGFVRTGHTTRALCFTQRHGERREPWGITNL